jgi:tRNA dimethylallyltransferase
VDSKPAPLLIVVGPTGSGKSELALRLAEASKGEIAGCDSVQIYRGFNIGAAKLTLEERRNIPHHLIDIAQPDELFTAGEYARRARAALHEIAARGHTPVVVGGTGFYLRALLEGLSPGPTRDEARRSQLLAREQRRPGCLHRILARLDPESAARIHVNDVNKTVRALEISILEKRPRMAMFARGRDPLSGFKPIKIGLNPSRSALRERLDARVVRMFERGLVEEARGLLESGVSPNAKPFESLGYKQALQVLRGEIGVPEAIASTQLGTRRYAKRQMTWFRREPGVQWIEAFGDDPETRERALTLVNQPL